MNSLLRIKLIKLNIGPYTFSPGILPTIVTLFFIYVMISMAQWQATKAQYKVNLEEKIAERKNLPAISLDELPRTNDERLFLPVVVNGLYDADKYFLLDNRVVNGRVGYDVYTPLHRADDSVILVNRGFVVQGASRDHLPEVLTPDFEFSVKGLLDNPPSKTVVLADNVNQSNTWPVVLQYLDLEEVKTMLGKPVFDMIIRLDENEEYGFTRVIPALNLFSAKNTGYAFQWYAMTMALIIIYFTVNTKKRERS